MTVWSKFKWTGKPGLLFTTTNTAARNRQSKLNRQSCCRVEERKKKQQLSAVRNNNQRFSRMCSLDQTFFENTRTLLGKIVPLGSIFVLSWPLCSASMVVSDVQPFGNNHQTLKAATRSHRRLLTKHTKIWQHQRDGDKSRNVIGLKVDASHSCYFTLIKPHLTEHVIHSILSEVNLLCHWTAVIIRPEVDTPKLTSPCHINICLAIKGLTSESETIS